MKNERKIIGVAEVPCTVCGAAAHEICLMTGPAARRGFYHVERMFDADDATRALNALLGLDE